MIEEPTTFPYNLIDRLRAPEDRTAYLAAWLDEAPGDATGIARALGEIARAEVPAALGGV